MKISLIDIIVKMPDLVGSLEKKAINCQCFFDRKEKIG